MKPASPGSVKLLPGVQHHAGGCGRHVEASGKVSQTRGRWQVWIPQGQGRTEQTPSSPSLSYFALGTTCVLCVKNCNQLASSVRSFPVTATCIRSFHLLTVPSHLSLPSHHLVLVCGKDDFQPEGVCLGTSSLLPLKWALVSPLTGADIPQSMLCICSCHPLLVFRVIRDSPVPYWRTSSPAYFYFISISFLSILPKSSVG